MAFVVVLTDSDETNLSIAKSLTDIFTELYNKSDFNFDNTKDQLKAIIHLRDFYHLQAVFILRLNNPSSTLVSVSQTDKGKYFSVYPNPTNGNIKIINSGKDGTVYVNVVNALGSVVKSLSFKSFSEETIDLSNLKSGNYTIQFIAGDDVVNERVVLINGK